MLLFTWGLFKKVVIADRLGLYVDAVYNDVHAFTGLPLLLATYAYAFQIYMDFSGYTDMALGSARLFNINLTQNFNSPYLATSVADFWRRWHISFLPLDTRLHLQTATDAVAQLEKLGHRCGADCCLSCFRNLAWCKLGICDLGWVAWPIYGLLGLL